MARRNSQTWLQRGCRLRVYVGETEEGQGNKNVSKTPITQEGGLGGHAKNIKTYFARVDCQGPAVCLDSRTSRASPGTT